MKLPDNIGLRKLIADGYTNRQIAEMHDVTIQAVDWRLRQINHYRCPEINRSKEILALAWTVKTTKSSDSHHQEGPIKALRLWLRGRLGEELPEKQQKIAGLFEVRLIRKNAVLAYDPEAPRGFSLVPRLPSDGRLAIRWPADRDLPDEDALDALRLPAASA